VTVVDRDNIKMDLQEVGGGVDRFHLAEDREMWRAIVNAVMNLRFPYNVGNFVTSRVTGSFSGLCFMDGWMARQTDR
jgi:hypothetical protein